MVLSLSKKKNNWLKARNQSKFTPTTLRNYLQEKWPGSIAAEYWKRAHNVHKVQFRLLSQIVKERTSESTISDLHFRTAVVHLRLGDVMQNASAQREALVYHRRGRKTVYVQPKSCYDNIWTTLLQLNCTNIVLMGSWVPKHAVKSVQFKDLVKKFFLSRRFNITERFNIGSPDDDFIFASNARVFVQAGGGYSNLIGRIVKEANGHRVRCNAPRAAQLQKT